MGAKVKKDFHNPKAAKTQAAKLNGSGCLLSPWGKYGKGKMEANGWAEYGFVLCMIPGDIWQHIYNLIIVWEMAFIFIG
ncbi:hypothetical protein [Pontibacter actiniarum]|uniref:Uncharacterized protein n=1 Tax=Pontibacter actiniarum TaxID=323450 RepID=A0A1X9YN65_9BACT|nr:hypothetical protein [Pontibacter actiniarum]ARS34336.1 hypothetical protein CA264_02150 [Pontibacter actiniarum]